MADQKCTLCHGSGTVWSASDPKLAGLQVKVTCPLCKGSGKK